VRTFLKLGAMSYGGPAIMGLMQAEIQERRRWLSKQTFVEGLALVNALPGPGATQLGIFLGYQRAGWPGGVIAGICFILPAFLIMLTLTYLYSAYGALPAARQLFYGVSPVVFAIFALAVFRLGRSAIRDRWGVLIALLAGSLTASASLGIIAVFALAGAIGLLCYGARKLGLVALAIAGTAIAAWELLRSGAGAAIVPSLGSGAAATAGAPGLFEVASFFFAVGAFTFGGGLSMLAFMQDQVVNAFGWLSAQEFLDGLALGQLTPGPILMLAAFVGFKLHGFWGALLAAAAIFLPSFLLMLTVLPFFQAGRQLEWAKAALRGVGPAVIGVTAVSLIDLTPHAIVDAPTALIAAGAMLGLLYVGKLGPLSLMLLGGGIGALIRNGR
jgi:chromate transporter